MNKPDSEECSKYGILFFVYLASLPFTGLDGAGALNRYFLSTMHKKE